MFQLHTGLSLHLLSPHAQERHLVEHHIYSPKTIKEQRQFYTSCFLELFTSILKCLSRQELFNIWLLSSAAKIMGHQDLKAQNIKI